MSNPYQFPPLNEEEKKEIEQAASRTKPLTLIREELLPDGSWERFYSDNSSETITNEEREARKEKAHIEMKKMGEDAQKMVAEMMASVDPETGLSGRERMQNSITITTYEVPIREVSFPENIELERIATGLDLMEGSGNLEHNQLVDAINRYVANRWGGLPLYEILHFTDSNPRKFALGYRMNAMEAVIVPARCPSYKREDIEGNQLEDENGLDWGTPEGLRYLDELLGGIANFQSCDAYFKEAQLMSEDIGIQPIAMVTGNRIYSLNHFSTLRTAMERGPANLVRPLPELVTPILKVRYGSEAASVFSLLNEVGNSVITPLSEAEITRRMLDIWEGLLELQENGKAVLPANDWRWEEVLLFTENYSELDTQMIAALRKFKHLGFRELRYKSHGLGMTEARDSMSYEPVDSGPGAQANHSLYYSENDEYYTKDNWFWYHSKDAYEAWRGHWVALDEFRDFVAMADTKEEIVNNKNIVWDYLVYVPLTGIGGEFLRKSDWWALGLMP